MNATELAATLNQNMPSIGFYSKIRRIEAYAKVSHMAYELCEDNDTIIEALALLAHMNKKFQKAVHTVVLNINSIPRCLLGSPAHQFALGLSHYGNR